MRSIIRFSLGNKLAIWILTIMVVFAGLYAGMRMKLETIPDINIPVVTVLTVYPGAAPEEVVNKVTKPIEQAIRNLNGVDVVTSQSMENISAVIVEYDYDKNMKEAEDEIRRALEQLSLPNGAQEPNISRLNINAFPVIALAVSDETRSPEELTEFVEIVLLPEVYGLDGVADVTVAGQQTKEIQMSFDPEKLALYGLTEETVTGIIQGSAIGFPLGVFDIGQTEKVVVLDGSVHTLEDLKNLQIPAMPAGMGNAGGGTGGLGFPGANMGGMTGNLGDMTGMPGMPDMTGTVPDGAGMAPSGTGMAPGLADMGLDAGLGGLDMGAGLAGLRLPTVPLGELATLEVISETKTVSMLDGKPAISLQIVKAPDANTVQVVNAVKKLAERFASDYEGLQFAHIFDQGEPIEQSVETMLNKALYGALFAMIVILLFLRNWRTTAIAVVSIPLSLLIAILLLTQMDITLNIMTLGAMTVAIGRVVDDSIVVIENIYRRMTLTSEKLKGKTLIVEATKEMFIPILSSTIVTIAVFFPLALVSGPVGELFMPFALTIVFALLASLLVSITVVPMLAHTMMGRGVKTKHHADKPGRLASFYRNVLNWSLNHKLVTFSTAVVLLLASLLLVPVVGTSFLPDEEQKIMIITYSPDPSERKEDVIAVMGQADEIVAKRDGVVSRQYAVGSSGGMMGFGSSDKSGLMYLAYKDDFPEFAKEKDAVLAELQPLGKGEWKHLDIMSGSLSGGGLSLYVFADSMEELLPAVEAITNMLAERDDLRNVDSSVSTSFDQYKLVIDQAKLSGYGMVPAQVGMGLMPASTRPVVTTVQHEGADLNVYVKTEKRTFADKADLENTPVLTPLGFEVTLKDIATIEEGKAPDTINRRDGRVYAEVTADIVVRDVGKVSNEVDQAIKELGLASGIEVEFGGVTEQMNETFSQLGLAMLAAVAIVYFILVITFHGGLAPFAILFSLPFAVIGGLFGLWVAGETISVTALIGALMLIGIVVTNAIVLIDRVIHKEMEGLSVREALLEAGVIRLRPILMTAAATIGALIPMALGLESGGGGMISKGLAVTVIGGLTSSTLLTLLIVPIVYEFFARFRRKSLREQLED